MVGHILSALLTRSPYLEERDSLFEISVAPPLGPFLDEPSPLTPPVSNASTAEFVSIVGSFIHSPSSVAFARSLRGEEALEIVDIIDEVGVVGLQRDDTPRCRGTERRVQATAVPGLDRKLRNQLLHLLYKIYKDCRIFPTSYTLQQGLLCAGAICSSGGFAYVSTGDYLGRRVAIKRLKIRDDDVPHKVFKVPGSSPTSYSTAIHLGNSDFVRKS